MTFLVFYRSETDIINVVEQRVWHAMEEGQFENLPGKGKPLDLDTNPHADPAEDTLYRILNKNGCAPEWVELNKEIRNSIAGWRVALRRAWMNKDGRDDSKWLKTSEALKLQLRDLNNKVCLLQADAIQTLIANHLFLFDVKCFLIVANCIFSFRPNICML